MKTIYEKIIFFLLLLPLLAAGCKKAPYSLDQFVGSWIGDDDPVTKMTIKKDGTGFVFDDKPTKYKIDGEKLIITMIKDKTDGSDTIVEANIDSFDGDKFTLSNFKEDGKSIYEEGKEKTFTKQ